MPNVENDVPCPRCGRTWRGQHAQWCRDRADTAENGLREAAAWVADGIGYPVQVAMPDHPMPQALWDALVDHVHADESGKWHGNQLDRDETEWWLADEAGRVLPPAEYYAAAADKFEQAEPTGRDVTEQVRERRRDIPPDDPRP